MPVFTVPLEFPSDIIAGLFDGRYERIGGVIQEAGSKHVVTWLRDGGQIASNPNLAGGILKPLLDASSGGLASAVSGAVNTAVTAHSHYLIMQQLQSLTSLVGFVGGVSMLNLAVSAVSLAVVLKRLKDIESKIDGLYHELQIDRDANLQAGLDAAKDAATASMAGNLDNRREYAKQAIDRLREARFTILRKTMELQSAGNEARLLAHLSQAMHVDEVLLQCFLHRDDLANAKKYMSESLIKYREMIRVTVNLLLGSSRAIYFHHSVSDEDLWQFASVRKWLSERPADLHNFLVEALFADRHDFWNPDVIAGIDADEKRRSIRTRLSSIGRDRSQMLPPHLLALAQSNALIENYKRLEGFQAEIEAIERLGITHLEWEKQQEEALAKAKINLAEHDDYVLLVDTQWLAQQSDATAA